jgi:RND family efflux transporter MFP subunit
MKAALLAATAASLFLLACGGSKKPAEAPGKNAAVKLPDDVKSLEKTLSPTAPSASSPSASAAGDADVFEVTGDFVPPVRSEMATRFPGRVGRILTDAGARVTAGQPMLELESNYLKLDLERAEAEVSRTKAALTESERDWGRKKDLLAKGSVSQAAFDRSEAAFEQAKAARAAAETAHSLATQRLSDSVLRSPIDGVVLERRTDVGQHLAEATIAFVVVQTAPLKLRFRVPERWLGAVTAGAPVRAKVDPYPDETFTGKVSVIVPAIDPASRTFTVEALFPNADGRLRPGLFARVSLDVKRPAKS